MSMFRTRPSLTGLFLASGIDFVLGIPVMLLAAHILTSIWSMYVAGTMGFEAMPFSTAVGVAFVVSLLKGPRVDPDDKEKVAKLVATCDGNFEFVFKASGVALSTRLMQVMVMLFTWAMAAVVLRML
jgi:hypothetical protein